MQAQLTPLILHSEQFQLQSYYRIQDKTKPLRIYIEGDGITWVSHNRLSSNPTPIKPVALELASKDNYPNILYLARPCQYRESANCSPEFWSSKRFSAEVVGSMNQAITNVTEHFRLDKIELIGFSGGAAIASLIASKRANVSRIITVAGNLDHPRVNQVHNVSPISESLSPINIARSINSIPQHHFVGGDDQLVPAEIAEAFAIKRGLDATKVITVVNGLSHTIDWKAQWPTLLKSI